MCKFNILKLNKHNSDCVTPLLKILQCLFTTHRLKSKLLTMDHMVSCGQATVTISPSSSTILPVPYIHSPYCHSSSTCSHFRAFALLFRILRRFFPQVFTRLATSLPSMAFPDSVLAHICTPAFTFTFLPSTGIIYLFTIYQPTRR